MSFINSKAPNILGQEGTQGLLQPQNPHATTNDGLGKRGGDSPIRKA